MSVLAIENILNKTIKLYESKCENILHNGYQLPPNLNDYQSNQLQELSDEINSIIEKEKLYELVRKQSIREEGIDMSSSWKYFDHARQHIDKILAK